VAPRVSNTQKHQNKGIDPWSLVFDYTLIPSRIQLKDLRNSPTFDLWKFLFLPEFAHGFLKWGAQVGYTDSWKELWLNSLKDSIIHPNNLKQVDWRICAMRERQVQNCQRSIVLEKLAGKIQTQLPIEAQVFLAIETLSHSLPYLIPIDFDSSKRPIINQAKKTINKKINSFEYKSFHLSDCEETLPKSIKAPWRPILALSKNWAYRSFSERLSTQDVELMARDLARLPIKWDASFLDELIEALQSKSTTKPAAKPWEAEEIIILQMGSAIGAPSQKNLKARVKTTPSLPIQGLDPNARIQLAEMAAGAGHEINNPLAILTGTIQKLQKDLKKPFDPSIPNDPGPALELMLRQVQRVRTQIEELMWFSRPPEPKPVVTNFVELKRIWTESVAEGTYEIPLSIRKTKSGSLVLDPIHFGRVARLIGEFLRQHLPKTEDCQPTFSLQKTGKRLVGKASGPFPKWTPSQILGLFTPFFCPKGFGRSSGLHLPAARALAEKSGWSLSFVQGSKGSPGSILLEIPVLPAGKPKGISKKGAQTTKRPLQENIRYRPVA
jgi:hypothetical protein